MRFEDVKKETSLDQPQRSTEGGEAEVAREAERFLRPQIHELLSHAAEKSDKKSYVMDKIASTGKTFFQGKEYLLYDVLAKIDMTDYHTDAELEEGIVRGLTNAITEFVASSGFSLQEAQQYFQNTAQEHSGYISLDKEGVLSYSRFEDKVDLHISKGLTRRTLREALSALAQIVQNDESIKTIEMTSWVVAAHPDIMRRYGFIVDETLDEKELAEIRADFPEEMKDKPIAKAYITREKFLEMNTTGTVGRIE